MKKKVKSVLLTLILLWLFAMAMPTALQASGSVIFDDQFTSPTLTPGWAISPGRGWYSLTDNPGYLRYIIDAQHVHRDTPGYAEPLLLVRSFSGDQWILTTAVTYNMRPSWPTDNRWMVFDIRGPGGMDILWIGRIVSGNWPDANVMYLSAGGNSQHWFFPNSPYALPLERWYFEIERNKDHVAIRASNDGNDSTFEYENEYTFPPGSFGNDQQIEIWGAGWWGSNWPPGYGDFDFMKVVSTSDTTPPVVSITAPAAGYYQTATLPALGYTVTDNLDPSPSVVVTGWSTAEGLHTVTVTATDAAGNVGSAWVTYAVDNTPPVVTITLPGTGVYLLSQVVSAATWSATDNLSGVVPPDTGTIPIDTSSVGTKTLTVPAGTATDLAGNPSAATTATYYVCYAYGGILQPINSDGNSIFKLGSTVPVKFQLRDADSNFVTNAVASIKVAKMSDGVAGTELEALSTSAATSGNLFRYDSTSNQYIFNLATKPLSAGTWQIRILLDDGTSQYVNISLR